MAAHQTIADVRIAVRLFFKRYNVEWLIEQSGVCSPSQPHLLIAASMKQAALS
jgi:hypothetical protein